jgi:hypothetical protein
MITVYHNFKFMKYALDNYTTERDERIPLGRVTVTAVALIKTDSLEEAYRLTSVRTMQQHNIDVGWEHNEGVEVIGIAKNHRSTSVGDVLMDKDGAFHVVEPLSGFRKLTPEEIADITFYTISKEEEMKVGETWVKAVKLNG